MVSSLLTGDLDLDSPAMSRGTEPDREVRARPGLADVRRIRRLRNILECVRLNKDDKKTTGRIMKGKKGEKNINCPSKSNTETNNNKKHKKILHRQSIS